MTAFDGMCALITGSASGLGAATAVALARSGARVIPVDAGFRLLVSIASSDARR